MRGQRPGSKLDVPDTTRRYMAAYYAARVAGGLCTGCGSTGDVVPGRKRCAVCLSKEQNATHRRSLARLDAGTCVRCGAADPPGRYCVRCLDKDKARYARRRALGVCVKCGVRVPVLGKQVCLTCRAVDERRRAEKRRSQSSEWRRTQRRLDAGQCPICTAPVAFGRLLCADCLADKRAANRARKAKWVAAAACTKCGHAREDPALRYCAHCRTQGYAYKKRYLLDGLCSCSRFRAPGRKSCETCLWLQRDAQRRRRAAAKAIDHD